MYRGWIWGLRPKASHVWGELSATELQPHAWSSDTGSPYVAQSDLKPSILTGVHHHAWFLHHDALYCINPTVFCIQFLILKRLESLPFASLPKTTESGQYIKVKNTDLRARHGRANLWSQNSKAETGRSLSLGQPGLYSNFQASQGYIMKPCLEINKYLIVK